MYILRQLSVVLTFFIFFVFSTSLVFLIVSVFCTSATASSFECNENELVCIEEGGERMIDGIKVTKPCWKYAYEKKCKVPSQDNCHEISAEDCEFIEERCKLEERVGNIKYCANTERDFTCETKSSYQKKVTKLSASENVSSKELVCKALCLDGDCEYVPRSGDLNNDELATSIGQLAALAKLKSGMINPETLRFNLFPGGVRECSKKAFGYSNCCNLSGGWGAKCRADERTLGQMRDQKKCVYVDEKCVDEKLGKCWVEKEVYCCYGSVLSKTLQVGAREQLGKNFGSAHYPQCGGVTLEEFTKVDMNKINFQEFLDVEVAPRIRRVSEGELSETIQKGVKKLQSKAK